MERFWNTIVAFFQDSGIVAFFQGYGLNLIMIIVACVLLFLAIKKDFEPYLLLPIAFGMLLVNIPHVAEELFAKGTTEYSVGMLADASANLNDGIAAHIFALLSEDAGVEVTKVTTLDLHNLVMNNGFVDRMAALGYTADKAKLIASDIDHLYSLDYTGLFGYLYYGVKFGIYPCLIFLCIGATTDFGPLIANKKTMLLGAAA